MRAELSRCLEACQACELHCALAMDVAAALDEEAYGTHSSAVLRTCAVLCAATASSIAALRSPDVGAVADALLACQLACRAARSECRRRSFDGGCSDCAEACGRCADLCEGLLARTDLAAA